MLIINTILRFFGLILCSHQRKGRVILRLVVEDYLKKWVLNRTQRAFHFIYKAPFDNGLTEHEFDHVMIGYYDETVINQKKLKLGNGWLLMT
jgi:isopentenyl-diphosphate delta-isomerase